MPKSENKGSIGRELASAHRSLRALQQSLERLGAQVRGIRRDNSATPNERPHPSQNPSPARLKTMRLQGRYLGSIRHLKSKAKVEVRALRAKKGVTAAIKRARELAGR